jgi:fructokinase
MLAGQQLTHEEFCKYVKSQYPNVRTIVITAAENGCFVFESTLQYLSGTPVTVKDAVGSGDAFSAAFMHIYAAGGHAVTAAKIANHLGAFVATQAGAIPQYPDEIISLLKVNSQSITDNLKCA